MTKLGKEGGGIGSIFALCTTIGGFFSVMMIGEILPRNGDVTDRTAQAQAMQGFVSRADSVRETFNISQGYGRTANNLMSHGATTADVAAGLDINTAVQEQRAQQAQYETRAITDFRALATDVMLSPALSEENLKELRDIVSPAFDHIYELEQSGRLQTGAFIPNYGRMGSFAACRADITGREGFTPSPEAALEIAECTNARGSKGFQRGGLIIFFSLAGLGVLTATLGKGAGVLYLRDKKKKEDAAAALAAQQPAPAPTPAPAAALDQDVKVSIPNFTSGTP